MEPKKEYSVPVLKSLMSELSGIFDVVRIVDPEETSILTFGEDGSLIGAQYTCFKVWNRENRCDNCTSMCACITGCTKNKYELIKDNIFYVVSKPIVLVTNTGKRKNVVLEIVSHVSDSLLLEKVGAEGKTILQIIDETTKKIYTDPLTGAYNRRYFNECVFYHHARVAISHSVGMVVLDISRFKDINDLVGFKRGDELLLEMVEKVKGAVSADNAIIRLQGDIFAIMQVAKSSEELEQLADKVKEAASTVVYDEKNGLHLPIAVGTVYTTEFFPNQLTLDAMLSVVQGKLKQDKTL